MLSLEPALAKLESLASPIFARIIERQSISDISFEEEVILRVFMAIQYVRTPRTRKQFQELSALLTEDFSGITCVSDGGGYSHCLNLPDSPWMLAEDMKTLTDDETAEITLGILADDSAELAKLLSSKDFVLYMAPADKVFYIGDQALVRYNSSTSQEKCRGATQQGLAAPETELFLPITPVLGLCLRDREGLNHLFATRDQIRHLRSLGCSVPEDTNEGFRNHFMDKIAARQAALLNDDTVELFNQLQVIESSKYIYSSRSDFETAKRLIEQCPEYRTHPHPIAG